MRIDSLLSKLHNAGAVVSVDGGRLVIDAPLGAVTDGLRAQLVKHKPALISRLQVQHAIGGADAALLEARHEIAAILVRAYQRYVTAGRRTSGDDRLANSGRKSVHGVVL